MSNFNHSEHYKVKKFIIYKINDNDDNTFVTKIFTLKALRQFVINDLWVGFLANHDADLELSQEDLAENDENIFMFLDMWNIKVERILVTDLI